MTTTNYLNLQTKLINLHFEGKLTINQYINLTNLIKKIYQSH